MSKRYKQRRRLRYIESKLAELSESNSCWCGEKNPYFAPIRETCGGYGYFDCLCGGDFCVCHNHGEVECFGCEDCEPDDDDHEDDNYSYQDCCDCGS